jgi:2-oxoglutarate dehydrogenase E2 component (dihydrolipoamide succinyltransferase)
MGESVAEATITNWLKEVGDSGLRHSTATDKVDSEVPSKSFSMNYLRKMI